MTATAGTPTAYTFDNATREAAIQVRLLASILDPHTVNVLERLEVRPGWQCLDIGPGAGTITTWFADSVAPTGQVTAIDIDPRHLPPDPRVDRRAADIRTVTLPAGHYDVIHARLVLMHLPERVEVLRQLATALRPGGAIVISEWDCTHPEEMLVSAPGREATEAFTAFQVTLGALAAEHGLDTGWARRVPVAMHNTGLTIIGTEVYNRLWSGGEAGCLLHASNSRQLQAALLARGMTTGQLNALRTAMENPETLAYSYWLYTTVGRRPY
jgi:SAM-dependent methyltransferase